MSPTEFRDALAGLGFNQSSFGRFLTAHGHPAKDVIRSVRRWAQVGPPGEVVVILALLRERPGLSGMVPKVPAAVTDA